MGLKIAVRVLAVFVFLLLGATESNAGNAANPPTGFSGNMCNAIPDGLEQVWPHSPSCQTVDDGELLPPTGQPRLPKPPQAQKPQHLRATESRPSFVDLLSRWAGRVLKRPLNR
jgi:hypothetical protein